MLVVRWPLRRLSASVRWPLRRLLLPEINLKASSSKMIECCRMSLDASTIKLFQDDYHALTGIWSNGFVCPITFKDTSSEELCTGHILNNGIRQASRRIVPQRRDVDNHFGRTLEADLVRYLNFPGLSAAEHLAQARRFTITFASGEQAEAFFASPKAGSRFRQVQILDSGGKAIASPYIKTEEPEAGQHYDIQIEWTLTVHDFALTGALIKAAYLALFRLVGYRYALDSIGNTVRISLAAFFNNGAGKDDSRDYFSQFQGAVIMSLDGALDAIPDTLEDGTMLFHFAEGNSKTGILFGVSVLFRVNRVTLIVTLPAYTKYGFSLVALEYYRALLKDRALRHAIHLARFKDNQFGLSPIPMDVRYVRRFT
jgi:hypothetical protein